MKRTISLFIVVLLFLGLLSGCTLLQKLGLQKNAEDELLPVSSIIIGEAEASKLTDKIPVRLYFANDDNTKLKLEIRYIDSVDAQNSASDMATAIINELIKGPSDESAFRRTVPAEAKLLSPVSIKNKVASVNFSEEFISKHPGGKDAERMTIYSIVNSLTELEEIEKVKFMIDGKSRPEFKGNFKFDSLFPRSAQLISKEAAQTTSGIADDDLMPEEAETGEMKDSNDTKETSGQNGETIDGLDGLEILE